MQCCQLAKAQHHHQNGPTRHDNSVAAWLRQGANWLSADEHQGDPVPRPAGHFRRLCSLYTGLMAQNGHHHTENSKGSGLQKAKGMPHEELLPRVLRNTWRGFKGKAAWKFSCGGQGQSQRRTASYYWSCLFLALYSPIWPRCGWGGGNIFQKLKNSELTVVS